MMFRVSLLRVTVAVAFTAAASATFAPAAFAQTGGQKMFKSQAGFHRMVLGDFKITAVSDGTVPQPFNELLTNTKPGQVDKLLAQAYLKNPVETSINAYIIETGAKLLLVDTGAGDLLGPTCGKLLENLRAAGYTPEQVDEVLITHIHTDHSGGLMAGSKLAFPNAIVRISKAEVDYWLSPANLQKAPADAQKRFRDAAAKVGPVAAAGKLKTFEGNVELEPGIKAIPSPGHTPGHTFYALESKGQKLVFWGDVMHVAAVQFPSPEVTIAYDVDPKMAAAARAKAYADAAKQGYWVAVDHISFPGIGHVRADGAGYGWVPINYSTSGAGQ